MTNCDNRMLGLLRNRRRISSVTGLGGTKEIHNRTTTKIKRIEKEQGVNSINLRVFDK